MMMNINEALLHAFAQLKKSAIASAGLDARLLLSHVLDKPYEYLLLNSDEILTNDEWERFLKLVDLRKKHKPLAYILGYKEFYGRNFKLNDKVLIPRPDTEVLVDAVISNVAISNPHILELGCGSGCVIISLLLEIPEAYGVACDIAKDALNVTGENSILHNIERRLEIINSNWFDNINVQKFDIIVSNPPYIAESEKSLVACETILFEPHLALFASDAGLAAYKIIASQAPKFLKKDGILVLEIGFNQLEAVKQILTTSGFTFKDSYKDINNHNRIVAFTMCD